MIYLTKDTVIIRAGARQLAVPTSVRPARLAPLPLDEAEAVSEAEGVVAGLLAEVGQQQDAARAMVQQAQALVSAVSGQPPLNPPQRGRGLALHRQADIPAQVRERARQLLASQALVLDLETTGLKKTDQVVELAVMDMGQNIVFQLRLKPDGEIPAQASQVHGIEAQHVETLPSWAEALPLLRGYLAGRVVLAHNAKFEAKFLPADWDIDWVCTKRLADQAFGQWNHWEARSDWRKSGSLENRIRQCGIGVEKAHTAAGDCAHVLQLVRFIAGL